VANLDFWLAESLHCLGVIDGYRQRFERLKAAQAIHVAMHGTVGLAPGEQHNKGGSALPRAVPDTELTVARRALCDATYRFLVRCFNEALIDEKTLRGQCHRLELSVEAADLRRES